MVALTPAAGHRYVLNMVIIAAVLGLFVRVVTPPTDLILANRAVPRRYCHHRPRLIFLPHLLSGRRHFDGLMVGLCRISGWQIGLVRTLLEGSVCLIGWLLGGVLGLGTLLFAFGVGWVVQSSLHWLASVIRNRIGLSETLYCCRQNKKAIKQ